MRDETTGQAKMVLARILGYREDPARTVLEYAQALEEHVRGLRRRQVSLDRLRIVRNTIVREIQLAKGVDHLIPSGHEGFGKFLGGLRRALELLYHEFDELERIPEDQKPICPFCKAELEPEALAEHLVHHTLNGDKLDVG